MKHVRVIILCVLTIITSSLIYGRVQTVDPVKDGYVPNKETAIKIAEVLWKQVYGNKIDNCRPFVAELKGGTIWIVQGTLYSQKGGVPYIEIQKSDCKVIKMYHGK